jgi:hypothetical protein
MLLLIVASGGYLIKYLAVTTITNPDPELKMGILVVVAIATLMTVLFILAAGFSSMSLTDPKQALGLPEGSIRAMIALVLIMVFIIFGIYLFRNIGVSNPTYLGWVTSSSDVKIPTDKAVLFQPVGNGNDGKGYNVYVLEAMSDEAKRLAQQLITTVGTLVVAIASFYFGSTLTTSASKKERDEGSAAPMIKDVTPRESAKGNQLSLEIAGTGFKSPRVVRLLRGDEAMVGTDVLSNATTIRCKVLIDKEPGGKWDIIVENEDGTKAQMANAFSIT